MTDTPDTSLYATEKSVIKAVGEASITHDKNLRQVITNVNEEALSRKAGDKEIEDASVVRDELLSKKIEDEVKGNTAAHIVLNEDIRNLSEVKYNKSGGPLKGPMTIRTPYGGNTSQLIVEAPDLGEQKAAFSVSGDGDVKAGYDANHPFLASARNDVVTKACLDQAVEGEAEDRAKGDEALQTEIFGMQEAFDAAIIAGQEGAENINIELQSYLKKEDANSSYSAKSHTHAEYSSTNHTHSSYSEKSHTHANMAKITKGTSTSPTLAQGEFYLNINQKVLYIGV